MTYEEGLLTLFQPPYVMLGFRCAADMVDVGLVHPFELHCLSPAGW